MPSKPKQGVDGFCACETATMVPSSYFMLGYLDPFIPNVGGKKLQNL